MPLSECLNDQTSSIYYDQGADFIRPPPREFAVPFQERDPQFLLNRLNEIQSPKERLITFLRSHFIPNAPPTHESQLLYSLTLASGVGGFLFGGIFNSKDVHSSYLRRHTADVFEGKYRASRHFWDTLVVGTVGRGIPYGIKTALLTTGFGVMLASSTAYRGDIYLPDFIIGCSALGALSRTWLGSRAMAMGGLLGGLVGVGCYTTIWAYHKLSGYTVTQLKILNHTDYLNYRDTQVRRHQRIQEQIHKESLARVLKGDGV